METLSTQEPQEPSRPTKTDFKIFMEISGRALKVASGHTIPILGHGSIVLRGLRRIELPGVIYCPGIIQRLLSVYYLFAANQVSVEIDKSGLKIIM